MSNMNTKKITKPWLVFWIIALVVALVFCLATVFLMQKFQAYLQTMDATNIARENARYELAVDAYTQKLDADYVADRLVELYTQADSNIQSEQSLRTLVKEELSGGIGCKASANFGDKRKYALYKMEPDADGKHQQIGEFTIVQKGPTSYGYTPWIVSEEYFNMDYLLRDGFTVMVPHNYTVWVNGKLLSKDYLVQTGIEYPALDPLKTLSTPLPVPTKVVYQTGTSLGDVSLEIRDPQDNVVTIDENTDWDQFLHNCTDQQEADIQAMMDAFMADYVRFSSTRVNCKDNYYQVITYMVPDGQLADRMFKMLDGLQWSDDYEDELVNLSYNHFVALSDGRFVCDLTYVVNVIGRKDTIQETTYSQIILVPVNGELKVESIINYKGD